MIHLVAASAMEEAARMGNPTTFEEVKAARDAAAETLPGFLGIPIAWTNPEDHSDMRWCCSACVTVIKVIHRHPDGLGFCPKCGPESTVIVIPPKCEKADGDGFV